jgi:hypothetical protein
MTPKLAIVLCAAAIVLIPSGLSQTGSQTPLNVALLNGQWFNGASFEQRTVYSVKGRFTSRKPPRLDRTLDLAEAWIVPPFAEAHNHNLATGVKDRERNAIQKYLADGVFYVKIQGNLPITETEKRELSLNRPDGLDVAFAQGSLTSSGGHPIALVESLLQQGYYPGFSRDALRDHRYFTIDSETDLEKKWTVVLSKHPDFLKIFLWFSDDYEKRKDSAAYFGQKGLDRIFCQRL